MDTFPEIDRRACDDSSEDWSGDVAIVGLALRVPGADSPAEFWENLVTGTETITHFEREELDFPEEYDLPNYVPAKGLVEDVDLFDAAFFGILPKEAKITDPQQRIFLELAWEAMERSGYRPDTHRERIGVYAGTYIDTYLLANLCTDRAFLDDAIRQIRVGSLQTEIGNDKDYLATRVSFKLNLRGPAVTVGTACSTSLVAIAEACRAIRDGLCDMALAGGVAITLPHRRGYFYTEQGINSSDGHCRVFDENGSGTVFGNGAGVVMLKRFEDAIRDRDHIHAVIRGIGLNNDGQTKNSYAAPSIEGQAEAIRMAQKDAGVDPRTITAIEAHGTGTPLGDPIEFNGLVKAFQEAGVDEKQFCALGSAKTFIGHLDVASGVCGVIKTALSLENRQLPPLLHFQKANPKITFENSPFYPNVNLSSWKPGPGGAPRRAGVSSYGVGGTNAHVILEEAPEVVSLPSPRKNQIFLLSAKTPAALEQAGTNLAAWARDPSAEADPADVAWTLATGRMPFRHRRAVVASGLTDLAKKAADPGGGVTAMAEQASCDGNGGDGGGSRPVYFLFPGQGSQQINMARAIYESELRFRETVDRGAELLGPILGRDLREVLFPGEGTSEETLEALAEELKDTRLAQPAIFLVEYALADLWRHWGLEPVAMLGHSVGEFVAACHAGVFTLEEALALVSARGRLMSDLPSGGMLSVRLGEEDLAARTPDTLDLAAVNGPSLCVVAGPHEELESFANALRAEGVTVQGLHTSHAFHSRMMDPVVDEFAGIVESISLREPRMQVLSTVTGEWLTAEEATDPVYWARHLRETVRFSASLARLVEGKKGAVFIEAGPGQTLTGLAALTLDRKAGHLVVPSCRHPKDSGPDSVQLLESLGRLWAGGVEIDWEHFFAGETRKRLPLPTYPFERKRHWVEATPATVSGSAAGRPNPLEPAQQPGPGAGPTSLSLTDTPVSALPGITLAEPSPSGDVSFSPTATMNLSSPASRTEAIAKKIREILTSLSGIPEEDLAGEASFLELGFDSLFLTQVSKGFQDEFGTEVKMRQLMTDFPGIDALVEHLDATLDEDRYRESAPMPEQTPVPASLPVPFAAVAAPSPAPLPTTSLPRVGGDAVQAVIFQQMELMRQQIALLSGTAQNEVPGSASAPVPTPVPAPAETLSKATDRTKRNERPAATSAPTTAINRNAGEALTADQQRHLDDLVARYTARTRVSKELTSEHRQWFADPRTVSGFNRLWKEMVYQIVVTKSKGSRLRDVDGNEYIDILNGFGPGFLGHSPDFLTAALHEQLDRGVEVGPQCLAAMEAAKLFCEVTGNERASFVSTGSEAVQVAIRLARTVTGRDKVVVFARDYHGNFDEVLVRGVGEGENVRSVPVAPGIPARAVSDMLVLPYGADESLEIIRKHAGELAAVLVEPVQSRRPEFQPGEFIREVREITREWGAALIFDEVITGFRSGPGGAQAFYGVEADIATYGKVVGGGMPIGVVAGKAEFMDTFDGGMWQYGDDSFPDKGVTFFAGTFVRHPLAMVAVKHMLLHLKERGPELWTELNERANRLAGTVDGLFREHGIPFRMPNFGSLMFVRAIDENPYANLLFFHLREKGVFLLEGFPSYLTTAHTDADVDYVVAAFRESVAEMQAAGFFPGSTPLSDVVSGSRLKGPERLLAAEDTTPAAAGKTGFFETASERDPEPDPSGWYPLTEPLAEIWLASQVSREASLCFNELVTLKLVGPLDARVLQKAVQDVVERHGALRSVFSDEGDGFRILPERSVELSVTDLSSLEAGERASVITATLDEERETPFDLEQGPLFRARLLKLGGESYHLVLNAHHIICDGWSYNVIVGDLGRCYEARLRGETPDLAPARQLGEHALEAVVREMRAAGGASETWWLGRFADPVPPLPLPLDHPRPEKPDFRCGTVAEWLDADTVHELKRAGGRSGATLCALLLATFQTLLHRIARQRRFVVAMPAAGQNQDGNESLVGHCVNFLPLVANVDGDRPFVDFLRKVQGEVLDALEHESYPYGQLLHKLGAAREGGRRSLVDAVFTHERVDGHARFPGIEAVFDEAERRYTTHPLFLRTAETVEGVELRMDFHEALFSAETVRHWLGSLRAMLAKIVAEPDATVAGIGASVAPWQHELLQQWNDTATPYPRDKSVVELFEEVAERRGDAVALRHGGGEMSYAGLDQLARRYARALSGAGAAPGQRVGLLLDRSPELVAAMIAVLKTGAAYVPMDPEYPAGRLGEMMDDSGATIVLTRKSFSARLPEGASVVTVEDASGGRPQKKSIPVSASDPAYLIYTSGSTGRPKGSLVPHRGIVRLVRDTDYCRFGEEEVIIQAATVCFDASVYEVYGALLNGGVLVLPPPGRLTVEGIAASLREDNITQLFLTTGLFQVMVDESLDAFAGVRQVLTGGDLVSIEHMSRFLDAHPECRLVHCYGPTENTTYSTCRTVTADDLAAVTVSIGGPIANSTVWILDEEGQVLPPGIPGELCTGGDGVALEYLGRPELTAEKFVVDPFSNEPGARLYRTGDLARYRSDGNIEFLGRIDQQVKIRGYRVEPGEVESWLGRHPRVGRCKVMVRGSGAADKSLAAYVSPANCVKPASEELAGYLRSKLPDYLVPSSIVVLDELPLNANGKIDTASLPDPLAIPRAVTGEGESGPGELTETQRRLTELWKDLLRAGEIGSDDDFFAMGGHSLLGMKLFARVQKAFGVSLPLAVLFDAPTVRQLAAKIEERQGAEKVTERPAETPVQIGGNVEDNGISDKANLAKHSVNEPGSEDKSAVGKGRGGFHLSATTALSNKASTPADTTVAIQPKGDLLPLFAVHGGDGGILFYGSLARGIGEDRPFYAFEAPALTAGGPIPEESVEVTAGRYLEELRKVQASGPYHLCGYSFGGVVAYEMACQLQGKNEEVAFLGLVDTENPALEVRKLSLSERVAVNWKERNAADAGAIEKFGKLSKRVGSGLAYRFFFEAEDALAKRLPTAKHAGWLRQVQLRKAHEQAMEAYNPPPFAGKLTLFRAMVGNDKFETGDYYGWDGVVGEIEIVKVPGNHLSIFDKENVSAVSEAFRDALAKADGGTVLQA